MNDSLPREAAEVLSFWFGPGMEERWFKKDPDFDREVRERLQGHYERARSGDYDHWMDSAKGSLALCLLLDQVPRNLFRDDRRAFATDDRARQVTICALDQGFDRALRQAERLFLYLPLEHSEDLDDQERCVELVATLDAKPDWLDYSVRHRDVIARFGRFPHRNRVMGRETTEEEAAFLEEPGSAF